MKGPKVNIENPCHMKWQELTKIEESNDRHCSECALDIKDFTKMTTEEIILFLGSHKDEKVCCAMKSTVKKGNQNTIQRTIKNWNSTIRSNIKESSFKTFLLFSIGVLMFTTGCKKDDDYPVSVGLPEIECDYELIPDTTTTDLNDSVLVENCDY